MHRHGPPRWFTNRLSRQSLASSSDALGATRAVFLAALILALGVAVGCFSSRHPRASRQPVATEYFNQRVTDDYQWLEEATNPAVRQWTAAQNARARAWLDHAEARPLVESRLRELFAR